jgi:hypothetical protein
MADSALASYRYSISGLIVASDIPLPMLQSLDLSGQPTVDVTMRLGEVPEHLEAVQHRGANWSVHGQRFLLDLPGIGRFLAMDGRSLTLQPAPGIAVDDILVFAMGTALAAILYQRGALLLHGAAVVHRGRSYVFCGPSGAGKSTLAGALCRWACSLASDDVCAVELTDAGIPLVRPDGRMLRLYPDSIARIGLGDAVGLRVRQSVEKYHVTPPAWAGETGSAPLAAIYVLAESNPAYPPGIVRFSPIAAAQALLRQSYRRRLALAYCDQAQLATRTARLLSSVGVYQLHRPRDFSRLDDTVAQLLRHWDRLG